MYHMLVKAKRMLSIIIIYSLSEPELESELKLMPESEVRIPIILSSVSYTEFFPNQHL